MAPQRRRTRARPRVLLPLALLLAGGCASVPTAYEAPPALAPAERPAHNLQVFDRAWGLVRDHYFDRTFGGRDWPALRTRYRPAAEQAPDDAALYAVLTRLLAELPDSHLVALPPRSAHELRTQHRAAVGMRWRVVEDRRVVTEIVPGSPAAAAGVQVGWMPVARDGVPLDEETPFTNEVGRRVTYTFLDAADQPVELTMTATLLSFERREARRLDGGALFLRFDSFSGTNLRWLSAQLKAHRDAPAVIVDLRQNPGGLAVALRLAVGEFFDRPVATGTIVRRNGRESGWDSLLLFSARYPGRVAILLDRFSASSAEIFAHVLRHHGRATLVGRPTAGAVVVARFYPLPGGGRLEVPVEDFVGLDGRRLEGRGVAPDVPVELTLADLRAGRDPDLAAALRAVQAP